MAVSPARPDPRPAAAPATPPTAPPTVSHAAAPLPPVGRSVAPSPASDDAPPPAGDAEPEPDALPRAGKAAVVGAMSAAEAALRQRAEADYQQAIEDAIRAAAWRTDDAVYMELVHDVVRARQAAGFRTEFPSSAWRVPGGFGGSWERGGGDGAASGTWDGYGVAAYGAFGGADAVSGAGPRRRPAVYGSGDEPVHAERAQFAVPLPLPPPPAGAPPRPGDPDYAGAWKELRKLWGQLPEFDDLPEVEKPFFMQLLSAIQNLLYNKPPHDAKDPHGAKAPGKPGEETGFRDPKGGERWVPNPFPERGGASHGWLDDKGRVWVPTGPRPGRAHGKPHWDVQWPNRDYSNVRPGKHIDNVPRKRR